MDAWRRRSGRFIRKTCLGKKWFIVLRVNHNREIEELSIEEMFDRLDGIMRTLEDSRSTLEESFASYEAGMRLVRACSEKIDKVEKQIMVVNGEETEA